MNVPEGPRKPTRRPARSGGATPWQDSEVDPTALGELLAAVAAGELDVGAAADRLRRLPYADLGYARVDHHRPLRQGMPEAVYGPGKTPEQCAAIVGELLHGGDDPVVLTRASEEQRAAVEAAHPGAVESGTTIVWRPAAPTRPQMWPSFMRSPSIHSVRLKMTSGRSRSMQCASSATPSYGTSSARFVKRRNARTR